MFYSGEDIFFNISYWFDSKLKRDKFINLIIGENKMKARNIDLETCEGIYSLQNVVYHFISNDMIEIHFSCSILDRDMEKLHAIIKTQLKTERSFTKTKTENGYHFVFDYPFTLICALITDHI